MLHRFPHYYPAFRCIDGACRDNCCRAGWEIDIDPDTLARYRRVPGELGRRLDEQIDSSGEAPCFRLDREGVCPFLTREGLCELYLRLGPDASARSAGTSPVPQLAWPLSGERSGALL